MECIAVKIPRLEPPQDDLRVPLRATLPALNEGDIVCMSSKVVALHEGQALRLTPDEKQALVRASADIVIERPYWGTPLTVVHNAFIGGSGLDESNGNGYVVLLPKDPFQSATWWHEWLCAEYNLKDVGVVITDSRSLPLRYGATGVAIGWAGFEPLIDHIGEEDIFGREFKYERSNIVDGIAAAATVAMGETNECQPVVIVRNVPKMVFTDRDTKADIFCPPEDDTFRVLYEDKF